MKSKRYDHRIVIITCRKLKIVYIYIHTHTHIYIYIGMTNVYTLKHHIIIESLKFMCKVY